MCLRTFKAALNGSLVLALVLAFGQRARATTFVMMNEQELAAQSVAVVTGSVTAIEARMEETSGAIHTYIRIAPTEVIAGNLPEGEIVLREIGGELPGAVERVFGSAQYSLGERVLVFLSQNRDGTLRTTAMAMGKYTMRLGKHARMLTRSLGEGVAVMPRTGGRVVTDPAPENFNLDEFVQRVRESAPALGADTYGPPVVIRPGELSQAKGQAQFAAFTYLGSPSRWFEADAGQAVPFLIDWTGDSKIGAVDSRYAMNQAMAAWSNVPNTTLRISDGGVTDPVPFSGCTGGSRLIFNDPFGDVTDPTNCGGVLAIGSYCATSAETRIVNGTTFRRIVMGKVTFNNGWENCSFWNSCNLAEVATHEIGHAIGLGHATDSASTMAPSAHFDGRCAALGTDEVDAVNFIYPQGAALTATATRPVPTATPTPTGTYTIAPTRTATRTQTAAARTATPTRTWTRVPTRTPTRTATRRPTATATPAGAWVSTQTPTRTATRRATRTSTRPPTPTPTSTRRPTRTPTAVGLAGAANSFDGQLGLGWASSLRHAFAVLADSWR
ncbi:MAG: matrixin family metalloprotease [Deltaproteobacteria bacterium]|nr:matrixin family metalloprotease [Deltaproteobacteria bacterium]